MKRCIVPAAALLILFAAVVTPICAERVSGRQQGLSAPVPSLPVLEQLKLWGDVLETTARERYTPPPLGWTPAMVRAQLPAFLQRMEAALEKGEDEDAGPAYLAGMRLKFTFERARPEATPPVMKALETVRRRSEKGDAVCTGLLASWAETLRLPETDSRALYKRAALGGCIVSLGMFVGGEKHVFPEGNGLTYIEYYKLALIKAATCTALWGQPGGFDDLLPAAAQARHYAEDEGGEAALRKAEEEAVAHMRKIDWPALRRNLIFWIDCEPAVAARARMEK